MSFTDNEKEALAVGGIIGAVASLLGVVFGVYALLVHCGVNELAAIKIAAFGVVFGIPLFLFGAYIARALIREGFYHVRVRLSGWRADSKRPKGGPYR